MIRDWLCAALGTLLMAAPVAAQIVDIDEPLRIEITEAAPSAMPIAIPRFFAPDAEARALADDISRVVSDDLRATGIFAPMDRRDFLQQLEDFHTPVAYPDWKAISAEALVTGSVQIEGDTLIVGFRLFDIFAGQPLGEGIQFSAPKESWRRVAHQLAGQIYTRITGEAPYFDTRIAFVGRDGQGATRIGLMDWDGAGLEWLTSGEGLVLAPSLSPDGRHLVYTSYEGGRPQLMLLDLARPVPEALPDPLGKAEAASFSASFGPDSRTIVFSREEAGNTDLWLRDLVSGETRQITTGPAIDTGGDFSPDGRAVVFESDRSGTPQLYLLMLDGSSPRRLTFDNARHGAPRFSPDGRQVAFSHLAPDGTGGLAVLSLEGGEERPVTDNPDDEGPSFAPDGRTLVFSRRAAGGAVLHRVDISGENMQALMPEMMASAPDWGPRQP